ncbi:hypothetical protein CMI37_09060 [Candidatus Pacearchaeota archaeon]|nr:hypothetical protein [Candidatus Pacearchaeota archaeon]
MPNKPWYQSKGNWTGLLTMLFGALVGTGVVSPEIAEGAASSGSDAIVGGVMGVLGLGSWIFRLIAKSSLR